MDDKEWDLVVAVHLKGAYEMTKACWPLFRGQKVGCLSHIFVFLMMSNVQRF
jgi:NAD(P)-dependent dehydrogenase (short-subunit alcohol dehydrogenase family)